MQVMQQEVSGLSGPLDPSDWRKHLPFEAAVASDRLGWVGLQAARYRGAPALEINLAVHLTRHVTAPRRPDRRRDGALPRGRLRAFVEYIEGHLEAGPSLEQMAAVARVSPYHFARQFKAAR
jgi:hypothetical protein